MGLQDNKNTSSPSERLILGVDPGTLVMGFGLIRTRGTRAEMVMADKLLLSKYEDHALRLKKILDHAWQIMDAYRPDELALEAPFYGQNVQSMLKLGRAQGVVMAAALSRDIPVTEYSPRKIKMAVTGRGNASKEQVAAMVHTLLGLQGRTLGHDETDALAVALCHFFNRPLSGSERRYRNWADFIKSRKKGLS
ncbi:MAG: crossover junction endodeoxyribonuclease RuvC [Chlorobi bacterium]|nr:crossover junction endodeoxyribonuclease RuvC [Chlorobiota bacterium]